ncbi:MAG: hypothetical protein ACTSRG_24700 [Candidatus Helarchaeota archaeon]
MSQIKLYLESRMKAKLLRFFPKKLRKKISALRAKKILRMEDYYDSLIKLNLNLDKKGYEISVDRWFGRLGNNLIQISNAMNIALNTKSRVKFPKYRIKLLKNLHMFDFTEFDRCNIPIHGHFYYPHHCYGYHAKFSDMRMILRDYINPILSVEPVNFIDKNTLVINIRSGDIFLENTPHRKFFQPPLSFYKYVINHNNYDDIIIVTERDLRNPCIRGLLRFNKDIRVTAPSPVKAASIILKARHLVLGTSSFCLMLSLLSKNIKIVHTCNPDYLWNSEDYSIIYYKLKNYPNDNWRCTPEQLDLMMKYPIENIKIAKNHESNLK